MNKILTPEEVRKIAERVAVGVQPDRVLLFGSYAWGQPGPGSDVDLLVIQKTSLSKRERRRRVSDLLRPRPVPIDIFVYTPEEISRAVNIRGSFVKEILERGKVLYEKQ